MGNTQQAGLKSNIRPAIVAPEPEKLNRIRRVLKYYTSCTDDGARKDFKTYTLGEVEVYGQVDPKTNELTGYGCLKIDGKMEFEGEFVNSLRNGYGIEYDGKKVAFEGNYLNDKKDGWGTCETYKGQYSRDKRQGWGVETNVTGRYEGFWKNDKYEGMGIKWYQPDVPDRVLKCVLEQILSPETNTSDTVQDFSCEVYIGEWKDGMRNGVGKLKRAKESYQGEFANDLYHGQGTLFIGNAMRKGVFDRGSYLHP